MELIVALAPRLVAMAALICGSAFFSLTEAALFYLRRQDRVAFASGNRAQRIAAALLADPDRLLTAVLFFNFVVNVAYFALASSCSIRLERQGHTAEAGALAVGALLVIIFFGEMLPKSMAVISTRLTAALVSVPMALALRVIDPVLPVLRTTNVLSRRLLWPRFVPEPYLELADLERALRLSTTDAALVEQEQTVLENIVALSEMRTNELMRPRRQFRSFRPPVKFDDLGGNLPPSRYVLVTEPDSDEIAGAIALAQLSDIPDEHLDHLAEDVIYVPWCSTVANTLEDMRRRDRRVAAVVNEFGETIGILTYEDVLEAIFSNGDSRSVRLLGQAPIEEVSPGVWHVSGLTSLRRLRRTLGEALPSGKSVTLAGAVQEQLERLPHPGDACQWGPFHLTVIDMPASGGMLVELTRTSAGEEPP